MVNELISYFEQTLFSYYFFYLKIYTVEKNFVISLKNIKFNS